MSPGREQSLPHTVTRWSSNSVKFSWDAIIRICTYAHSLANQKINSNFTFDSSGWSKKRSLSRIEQMSKASSFWTRSVLKYFSFLQVFELSLVSAVLFAPVCSLYSNITDWLITWASAATSRLTSPALGRADEREQISKLVSSVDASYSLEKVSIRLLPKSWWRKNCVLLSWKHCCKR